MTSISLQQFISYAYEFLIALAVVLSVFMITWGGFEYMMSAAITDKNDAVERIRNAVFGLLLALCTYLILYTIDPALVNPNNLSIPPISITNSSNTSSQSGACVSGTDTATGQPCSASAPTDSSSQNNGSGNPSDGINPSAGG